MARIPEEEVERLKAEVSLVRLVEGRGIKLKKHGANLMGLCPFHDDRSPSLVISPSKNLWHCLGACQAGGSVIDWVMLAEKCSFRLAVEMLKKEHPSLAASSSKGGPKLGPKLAAIAEGEEPDGLVLGRVTDHYATSLKESPEALEYLQKRGLVHAELLETFRLGYANRTLGYRLPSKKIQAGAVLRAQLQRLGVVRASGHEHFTGSITIPLLDAEGAVVDMYGRKVRSDLRPGTPLHLYLPGAHRGVFNRAAFAAERDIILCESLIDALTFWCAGFRNVTSAYGVEGFTPELRACFASHGSRRVLIAYDRDEAGENAAAKLAPELASEGLEVFRIQFPKGMDANAYALQVQPASKSFDAAIRGAHWLCGTRSVQVATDIDATSEQTLPPLAALQVEPSREGVADEAPHPAVAAPGVQATEGELVFSFGPRTWRIRGLEKNQSLASIKVTIRIMRGGLFFTDTLDIESARARGAFLKQAREELEEEERVLKADLGRVILLLEERVEAQLKEKLSAKPETPPMSEGERAEALALLKDPALLQRIVSDFERCGVVGEETNKLVGYLAAVSRKLEAPLAVVIQSSSAAGKSSLMDAILRFVPEEEQVSYSAMTGQSLFYMGDTDLQHKVLAIAEEEGASNASYALKVLQSSGELTIASTGKDPASGRLVTHEYRVNGPVMVMLTTTSIEIDEELLNRCVVLTVDEGREQTRAIQHLQRQARTLEGLIAKQQRGHIMQLHQNAQRLIRPLPVVNPFAMELSFSDHATRARRDHAKYLALIDTIALVHQHQRPLKTADVGGGATLRYIEVTREDIALADELAAQVLTRSLDELPPQTRRLLGLLEQLVAERAAKEGMASRDVCFTRRDVRETTGWGDTQLKVHLARLVEMELVLVHAGGARKRMVYQLAVDSDKQRYDRNWSGAGRPLVGAVPRPTNTPDSEDKHELVGPSEKTEPGQRVNGTSYVHRLPSAEQVTAVAVGAR